MLRVRHLMPSSCCMYYLLDRVMPVLWLYSTHRLLREGGGRHGVRCIRAVQLLRRGQAKTWTCSDRRFIDEEGCLSSRKLSDAYGKYDYRRYSARYGALEHDFHEWLKDCCEHPYCEYCSERVSNWSGVAEFESLVEEAGGKKKFPLLTDLLPHANGGVYPASKAQATLDELH